KVALTTFPPGCQPPGKNQWRHLAVEITPTNVELFWEGSKVGELTLESLNNEIRDYFAADTKLRGIDLSFAPHGGIGLFIDGGKAAFKDVHVKLITER